MFAGHRGGQSHFALVPRDAHVVLLRLKPEGDLDVAGLSVRCVPGIAEVGTVDSHPAGPLRAESHIVAPALSLKGSRQLDLVGQRLPEQLLANACIVRVQPERPVPGQVDILTGDRRRRTYPQQPKHNSASHKCIHDILLRFLLSDLFHSPHSCA